MPSSSARFDSFLVSHFSELRRNQADEKSTGSLVRWMDAHLGHDSRVAVESAFNLKRLRPRKLSSSRQRILHFHSGPLPRPLLHVHGNRQPVLERVARTVRPLSSPRTARWLTFVVLRQVQSTSIITRPGCPRLRQRASCPSCRHSEADGTVRKSDSKDRRDDILVDKGKCVALFSRPLPRHREQALFFSFTSVV